MTPSDAERFFEQALEHHACGRDEEAKAEYVRALAADATHRGALNNLGTLLFNTGFRSAARTAYRQAVAAHPNDLMSRVNYGNALYDNGELWQAREQFEAALAVDPGCVDAHRGMANVLERLGDLAGAEEHRDLGYRGRSIAVLPYRGTGRATAVLLLISALGGNVNTEHFLDDRRYLVTKLFAEYYDPSEFLPFHAFVFNAIGDADLSARALDNACALLRRTNAPAINIPENVARTTRCETSVRLGELPGVVTARTQRFSRRELAAPHAIQRLRESGFGLPFLLRSPGFHTGHHFVKIDSPDGLRPAVDGLPGNELLAIEYLDTRSRDGLVRKYRTMIVDGKLYPLHLAVSQDWKVHYFTARTASDPAHREEERRFLEDARSAVGEDAMRALESIAEALQLDYAGIDFALDDRGNVVVFEANAPMLVPPVPADPVFDYRRPAVDRIFAALDAMLSSRAGEPGAKRA
ncbi:MAG TPA: tetratricopeptide repeat protein [Candidatus Acidoferrales bacterium]|nr:tetratricopeptide repeat protein [Candidatus Acidoferrales bacterium]